MQDAINIFNGLKVNAAPFSDQPSPCGHLWMPGYQARNLGRLLAHSTSVSAGGSLIELQS